MRLLLPYMYGKVRASESHCLDKAGCTRTVPDRIYAKSGRLDLNQRPLRPEYCGLLILAAEQNPSKSSIRFELGKVRITTLLTYIVHRLHELARITRDSVPDTVPSEKRCPTGDEVSLIGGAV